MIENNADMPKKLTKKTVLNEILDVLETVFISAFLITMFFTFVLRMATVKGESMLPTLYPDERILVYSWDTDYSLGDIIVIDCQESVVFSDDGQL
ncbi:MAG: S24/S26 family peptidase, partial [Ruminococcus sp.]|nr:S24/S26 family peptidase [Ruminococcus sp.]